MQMGFVQSHLMTGPISSGVLPTAWEADVLYRHSLYYHCSLLQSPVDRYCGSPLSPPLSLYCATPLSPRCSLCHFIAPHLCRLIIPHPCRLTVTPLSPYCVTPLLFCCITPLSPCCALIVSLYRFPLLSLWSLLSPSESVLKRRVSPNYTKS